MKVLLVDDHLLFLEGLRNLLEANDIHVAGTANNSRDALVKTAELQPDVILMDVQMPEFDGIATTKLIKSKYPATKIVMLTVVQDDQYLFEAVKAGASGYLLKGLSKDKFLELLAGIARGEAPLSPGLASKILAEFARRENEREIHETAQHELSALLTSRQIEVLKLLTKGLTYKEIGDKLKITEAAVKYHMGEITSKLQLDNRAQVLAYAAELGIGRQD